MRYRDWVAEQEANNPAFMAAREAMRPQRELERAAIIQRIQRRRRAMDCVVGIVAGLLVGIVMLRATWKIMRRGS